MYRRGGGELGEGGHSQEATRWLPGVERGGCSFYCVEVQPIIRSAALSPCENVPQTIEWNKHMQCAWSGSFYFRLARALERR